MKKNLYSKVFDKHIIKKISENQYQIFIGLHLIHEVTSPQAFDMLKEENLKPMYPNLTFATIDHMIPTDKIQRPFQDALTELAVSTLEKNVAEYKIKYFCPSKGQQGIVHIIGPELGLTQPGMTICCGDSHTSTHGAFGAIAFGIGTSEVKNVLASQTLITSKLKVRKIEINGKLKTGVYAKDIILYIINKLGVEGGIGYAYEYAGTTIKSLSMEERMTICNMSIEGGARVGYIAPDEITFSYLKNKAYSPKWASWEKALEYWQEVQSDADAYYDDIILIDAEDIEPFVTWGINPSQSIPIGGRIQTNQEEALEYMKFKNNQKIKGQKIDVAFIGSCTNGRFSDFEEVVKFLKNTKGKVAKSVKALIVPGSQKVKEKLIQHKYDLIFKEAGFEFREPGCSMCLAMNSDKLLGDQTCASSSNRNYKGRQGSATGKTLLMSPVMVAAAAISGEVSDARELMH